MNYPKYIIVDDYAAELRQAAIDRRRRMGIGVVSPVVLSTVIDPPVPEMKPAPEPEKPAAWNGNLASIAIGRLPVTKSSIRQILDAVSEVSGIAAEEMLAPGRKPKALIAKQAAVYIAAQAIVRSSKSWLGLQFARKHSTIDYAIKAVQKKPEIYAQIVHDACQRIQWPS